MRFLDPVIRLRHSLGEKADVDELIVANVKSNVQNVVDSPVSGFELVSVVPKLDPVFIRARYRGTVAAVPSSVFYPVLRTILPSMRPLLVCRAKTFCSPPFSLIAPLHANDICHPHLR
jgi:hypothetical protein